MAIAMHLFCQPMPNVSASKEIAYRVDRQGGQRAEIGVLDVLNVNSALSRISASISFCYSSFIRSGRTPVRNSNGKTVCACGEFLFVRDDLPAPDLPRF
jgi:hypothetical protein